MRPPWVMRYRLPKGLSRFNRTDAFFNSSARIGNLLRNLSESFGPAVWPGDGIYDVDDKLHSMPYKVSME